MAEAVLWLGSYDLCAIVGIFSYMVICVKRGMCSDIKNGFIKRIHSCSNHYAMDFKLFCDRSRRLYDLEFFLLYYIVVIISVFSLGFGHPWDSIS